MFKTIEKEAEGIIVEKKSKFIAKVFYVQSEEEAEKVLINVRKEYHDARHNCYAYRIIIDGRIVEKQSDDGEPSGTAGAPMLNILEKKDLANVLVIVTRYFGGILLGTGGLVKAYSDATKLALENAAISEKEEGYVVEVKLKYEDMQKIEYLCNKENIMILEKEYTDNVKLLLEISKEKYEHFVEKNLKNNFQNVMTKIKKEKYITKN